MDAYWLLGGLQALWLVALVVVGVRRAVRPRVLLASGLGLLVSLVVSTTASPVLLRHRSTPCHQLMAAARGVQVYADPAGHPFCLCWVPGTNA
ncbi:hypothetical protein GCM10010530_65840 [Kribbella aluminosa]